MNIATPVWMRRRESSRSFSAPTGTEKSKYGSQWETTAKPPSEGEWNFWKETQ